LTITRLHVTLLARNERREREVDEQELRGWFAGRVPGDWFQTVPEVVADREEILVTGTLAEPDLPEGADAQTAEAACEARIAGFREDTRGQRMRIAAEAERRFGRKVSWAARCGDVVRAFTTLSVPAMTRLRMAERRVLDTLVDAGVARSRSHALAWCVRLVAEKQDDWLSGLRDALTRVEEVRKQGPTT
jgi:hypothetical protein